MAPDSAMSTLPQGRPGLAVKLGPIVDHIWPGAVPLRLRRLRGGVGTFMHVVELRLAPGERRRLVLRRYQDRGQPEKARQLAVQEFEVLQLLAKASFAAPRPLWLDSEGQVFGTPTMLLSYLPGRPVLFPKQADPWLQTLAQTLQSIHSVELSTADASKLRHDSLRAMNAEMDKRGHLVSASHDPLVKDVQAALLAALANLELLPPTLIHGDFWPGNVIWRGKEVAGVIDWTAASLGDRRIDVGVARSEVTTVAGLKAAEAFQKAYEIEAGLELREIWFFDLYYGLEFLLHYREWIAAYHDVGLADLTAEGVRKRLQPFIEAALERAPAALQT